MRMPPLWLQAVAAVLVNLITIVTPIMSYLVQIEHRLTRIETTLETKIETSQSTSSVRNITHADNLSCRESTEEKKAAQLSQQLTPSSQQLTAQQRDLFSSLFIESSRDTARNASRDTASANAPE